MLIKLNLYSMHEIEHMFQIHLQLSSDIPFSSQAKNLDVTLSSNLSMEKHVTNVYRSAYVEIRRISNIRHYLTTDATKPSSMPLFCQNFTIVILCYQGVQIIFLTNCKRSKILQQDLSSKLGSKNTSNIFFKNSTGYQFTQESSTKSQPCATILSLKLTHSICLNF